MRTTALVLAVAAVTPAAVLCDDPTPPVFPSSWSAHVHTIVKEVTGGGGKLNCDFAFDSITNQTSYRNCGEFEEQTVTRYDDNTFGTFGKHYYLSPPTSKYPTGMCQYWCDANGDIQPNEEESLESYDYEHRAKFDSSTTLNGTTVDVFKWIEPLAVVSMADQHLYVVQNEAIPVYREHHLHPFGKDEATIYTNYTNFIAAQPNASAFDIPNLKYCEQGSAQQCPDSKVSQLNILNKLMVQVDKFE